VSFGACEIRCRRLKIGDAVLKAMADRKADTMKPNLIALALVATVVPVILLGVTCFFTHA
jgi:hypothetical protein